MLTFIGGTNKSLREIYEIWREKVEQIIGTKELAEQIMWWLLDEHIMC